MGRKLVKRREGIWDRMATRGKSQEAGTKALRAQGKAQCWLSTACARVRGVGEDEAQVVS